MARKFNFSIQRVDQRTNRFETVGVEGCDSFDEAIKLVERGVYERELAEKAAGVVKNPIQPVQEPSKTAFKPAENLGNASSGQAPAPVHSSQQPA